MNHELILIKIRKDQRKIDSFLQWKLASMQSFKRLVQIDIKLGILVFPALYKSIHLWASLVPTVQREKNPYRPGLFPLMGKIQHP